MAALFGVVRDASGMILPYIAAAEIIATIAMATMMQVDCDLFIFPNP